MVRFLGIVLCLLGGVAMHPGRGDEPAPTRVRYYDGKTLHEWIQRLDGKVTDLRLPADPRLVVAERASAASILGRIAAKRKAGAAGALRALLRARDDKEGDVRAAVTHALGDLGPEREGVMPALCKSLEDESVHVRGVAIYCLGKMGRKAKAGVPALGRALQDPERSIRYRAVDILAALGPDAKEAVPALIGAIQDKEQYVRVMALQALKAIGPKAVAAVPALIQTLRHRVGYDTDVEVAIDALGAIGPCAAEALPALRRVATDPDPNWCFVRPAAAGAIWQITAKPAEPLRILRKILWRDAYGPARQRAAELLGVMGAQAGPAVPDLIDALDDINDDVGKAAAAALKKIDPKAAAKAGVK